MPADTASRLRRRMIQLRADDRHRPGADSMISGLAAMLARSAEVGDPTRLTYTAWTHRFLDHLTPLDDSAMHLELDELWDDLRVRRDARENILGHRKSAKTTRTRSLIIRSALEGWEPYVLLIMDTAAQAEQQLGNIKTELEHNPKLRLAYPESSGKGPRWREDFIILPNGVRIDCLGAGQKVRGRVHGPSAPTLIIADDLQNDESVESRLQRDKDWRWWLRAVMKSGEVGVNVVNLATTLHPDAISLRLKRQGQWRTREYPAIAAWPRAMDLWRAWETIYHQVGDEDHLERARAFYEAHRQEMEAGHALNWPSRLSLYSLMEMRAAGHAAFGAEMQCDPIDPELTEFDAELFGEEIFVDAWPPLDKLTIRTVAIDPSKGKDAKRGDYCAIVQLGRDDRGLLYVECRMQRIPAERIVETGLDVYVAFQPHAFGIEATQFQELFIAIFETVTVRRNIILAVQPIEHAGANKATRVRRLDPYLNRRRFRFVDTPGTRMLVDQLRYWPQADHDDGPDALEMALRLAIWLDHGLITKGDEADEEVELVV